MGGEGRRGGVNKDIWVYEIGKLGPNHDFSIKKLMKNVELHIFRNLPNFSNLFPEFFLFCNQHISPWIE